MRRSWKNCLKQRILYQNKFLLLTAADGIACVLILIGVSRFFTRNLTSHIMEPLDTLAEGAKRIQNNDLQQAKKHPLHLHPGR